MIDETDPLFASLADDIAGLYSAMGSLAAVPEGYSYERLSALGTAMQAVAEVIWTRLGFDQETLDNEVLGICERGDPWRPFEDEEGNQ